MAERLAGGKLLERGALETLYTMVTVLIAKGIWNRSLRAPGCGQRRGPEMRAESAEQQIHARCTPAPRSPHLDEELYTASLSGTSLMQ